MGQFRPITAVAVGLVVGSLNGLLAAGATLLVPAMVHVLRLDQRRAHGTSLWVIVPISLTSLLVYGARHGIEFSAGWKVAAGGGVGGYLGAHLMAHVPAIWLKRIFAALMLAAALRMVLG